MALNAKSIGAVAPETVVEDTAVNETVEQTEKEVITPDTYDSIDEALIGSKSASWALAYILASDAKEDIKRGVPVKDKDGNNKQVQATSKKTGKLMWEDKEETIPTMVYEKEEKKFSVNKRVGYELVALEDGLIYPVAPVHSKSADPTGKRENAFTIPVNGFEWKQASKGEHIQLTFLEIATLISTPQLNGKINGVSEDGKVYPLTYRKPQDMTPKEGEALKLLIRQDNSYFEKGTYEKQFFNLMLDCPIKVILKSTRKGDPFKGFTKITSPLGYVPTKNVKKDKAGNVTYKHVNGEFVTLDQISESKELDGFRTSMSFKNDRAVEPGYDRFEPLVLKGAEARETKAALRPTKAAGKGRTAKAKKPEFQKELGAFLASINTSAEQFVK